LSYRPALLEPLGTDLRDFVYPGPFYSGRSFPTFPGDEWALLKFQGYQSGWLTAAALGATHLGDTWVAASLAGVVIAGLLLLRHRTDALIIFLGVIFIATGNALKLAVGRPRPEYVLVDSVPATLSFPSGHALFAVIFGGFLIFLAGELVQPRLARWGLQASLALLVLAVGASRVYLGFHWPSDVVGGYLFGTVAVLELVWLRNRLVSRGPHPSLLPEGEGAKPVSHQPRFRLGLSSPTGRGPGDEGLGTHPDTSGRA
jgi:membrane-associated phospholipid phosphatase